MGAQRWATFDCYGTLIDWNAGIRGQLERLFGVQEAPRLLERYHELEPELESEPFHTYHEVLTLALERLAQEEGVQLPEGEAGALPRSLPDWPPFPDVPPALAELRDRGWKLALLSNTDRDLIAASQKQLGVPVDLAIVAEDVGSYKPAHGHWERFFDATTLTASHTSTSRRASSTTSRRRASSACARSGSTGSRKQPGPEPDRELTDLANLPDTLEELVPA